MSRNGAEATSKKSGADAEADATYHVRLILSWPPSQTSTTLDKTLVSSFYGLQLELRGNVKDQDDPQSPITLFNDGHTVSKTGEIRKPASASLQFGSDSAPSTALLETLDAITGPFEVVVTGKVLAPAAGNSSSRDEDARASLQQTSSVQVENTLVEINGERFLVDRGATGADVYRRLWVVASRASLATPFELTLRRHNLVQASAKIVPFAGRKDVQDAQIAQLAKLAAQDAALPVDIRRKKLFLFQQLDFEREHYLVAYVSGPLQELHRKIMGSCQWQVFEFGKTLWYFHAPTARLCAQHPLRSHPEARELLERVQQQVQQAVRRLQRKTRSRQRRQRLMSVVQAEMRRQEQEKREVQELHDAVRRIQHRIRAHQRRKRFLAIIQAEKRRQEEVRRQQQLIEERRREEQRAAENQQFETMKLEWQRLQQELGELKQELQQLKLLKETTFPIQSETQTSARREEDSAVETMRREEQQRLQQRLERLELELHHRKETKPAVEMETQTTARRGKSDTVEHLRHQNTEVVAESVTQTSGRRSADLRDEGVDTGEDLEWQRYLTLLRVTIKNKKKKSSPKSRQTQTECFYGEETFTTSSMFRVPQSDVSFSASRKLNGEWKGFPSWQRVSASNSSGASSVITLKSSLSQFDELDVLSPPTRTFESFFAPDLVTSHEQPPPPLVEHAWRQDSSTFLPLKSSRKMLEVAPAHQPLTLQLHEYQEPIRPIRTMGNSSPLKHNSPVSRSPASSPTRLPYITRRRKNIAGSPS
ncbi:hypothetical protein PHYPSEUDO_014889 [Phytophthora pseudosyringae]|uniref:Uncharacterized protein n=1 Tax=Phytophthora pseudosyringae TaxID=221518 RepID=A0A8T1W4G8_9STRA|nr:hypothetical protein PHYPSEUDO_014889 [Phytophthora pseudosyringae]